MLQWLISLFVIMVCVQLFSAVTPGVDIDGRGPAIAAAVAVAIAGYLVGFIRVPPPVPTAVAAVGCAAVGNVLAIAFAAAVIPGVRIRGLSAVLCLGGLLTIATVALGYGWQFAAGAGILSAAG
jgi:uncharacterized membrane protein YvlD (DUF360 family)